MLGERFLSARWRHCGRHYGFTVVTIKAQATIAEAAQSMDEKRIRRLPVVDDKNKLIGIISRADILKAVIRNLT